jgi:hypothetical protein
MFGIHSTYRTVHALSFARSGAPCRDGAMAERVAPWLRKLRSEDVSMLRPLLTPVTFGPPDAAVQWGIVTDGDRGIDLWQATWKARVIGRQDESPFKVTYTGARFSRWSILVPPPITIAGDRLRECLYRFQQVADASFDRTLRLEVRRCCEYHDSGRKDVPGMSDLFPAWLDPTVAALCASATRTFNIMNSAEWFDVFSRSETLGPVVRDLWRETMACFESAACAPAMSLRKIA